ncbi:MAG: HAD-IB family phosphatase [Fervidicoccaceae archaeon]
MSSTTPRKVKIVAFDMDGVLVPHKNSWDLVHARFGVLREAEELALMFRRGEIDYYDWLYLSTLLWLKASGGTASRRDLEKVFERVDVDPRFLDVIERLRSEGRKIVIVSCGVSVLVEKIAKRVKADEWHSSLLVFDSRGRLVPGGIPRVEAGGKGRVLLEVAERMRANRSELAFVGDSVWDREAFAVAGLPILYGDDQVEAEVCARARSPEEILDIVSSYERGALECEDRAK